MSKKQIVVQDYYKLSSTLKSILEPDQLKMLMGRTPKNAIATRPGPNNMTLAYVPHACVRALLNLIFGWDWDFELLPIDGDKKYCIDATEGRKKSVTVLGRLTVRITDGEGNLVGKIVKEDYGGSYWKNKEILTNALKGASSDSLKRCAMALGIGLDLYSHGGPEEMEFVPESEEQARVMELAIRFEEMRESGKSIGEVKAAMQEELSRLDIDFRTVFEQAKQNRKVG